MFINNSKSRLNRVSQPPATPAVDAYGRRPVQCRIQNAKFKIKTPPSFGHLPFARGGVNKNKKTALQNLRKKGGASAEG
ncbi:MAG: hypothetical protein IKK27_04855 [Alistipes sp.]|nr:hypothetical protein [Alistipes sp.]